MAFPAIPSAYVLPGSNAAGMYVIQFTVNPVISVSNRLSIDIMYIETKTDLQFVNDYVMITIILLI